MNKLTHFDARGQAHMVDVAAKGETARVARAVGRIRMRPGTLRLIARGAAKKGDVLGVARVAAIQAAKRASELIPLCHPLAITNVSVDFKAQRKASAMECSVSVATVGRTGVEMEALTAVAAALLTIYDMCKAVDRGMRLQDIRLIEKKGGKSGHWRASRSRRET
ncbi:MAG TPA: cyclic pyranopterin monophosphate synthase MoaC [Burkholderiales bacterium]|jgi:cyclic pyranopterin phosphate synthase|nr:cyclic pyranopterin monophosphate synthase MoaC [Burkholderiales bacterium]